MEHNKTVTLEVSVNEKMAIHAALCASAEAGQWSPAIHTDYLQCALRTDEPYIAVSQEQIHVIMQFLMPAIETAEGRADDWARASDIKNARESLIAKIRKEFKIV